MRTSLFFLMSAVGLAQTHSHISSITVNFSSRTISWKQAYHKQKCEGPESEYEASVSKDTLSSGGRSFKMEEGEAPGLQKALTAHQEDLMRLAGACGAEEVIALDARQNGQDELHVKYHEEVWDHLSIDAVKGVVVCGPTVTALMGREILKDYRESVEALHGYAMISTEWFQAQAKNTRIAE